MTVASVRIISKLFNLQSMSVLNNPQNRDITVSSLTGTGTARGLAKLYGIVANGGTDNQHKLLSTDMIRELSTPVVSGEDMVLRTGNFSRNGPGTMLMSNPLVRHLFALILTHKAPPTICNRRQF